MQYSVCCTAQLSDEPAATCCACMSKRATLITSAKVHADMVPFDGSAVAAETAVLPRPQTRSCRSRCRCSASSGPPSRWWRKTARCTSPTPRAQRCSLVPSLSCISPKVQAGSWVTSAKPAQPSSTQSAHARAGSTGTSHCRPPSACLPSEVQTQARPAQAAAAGNSVPWMAAHCGHVLVPAHHEVFVVDDLHKDARCSVRWVLLLSCNGRCHTPRHTLRCAASLDAVCDNSEQAACEGRHGREANLACLSGAVMAHDGYDGLAGWCKAFLTAFMRRRRWWRPVGTAWAPSASAARRPRP